MADNKTQSRKSLFKRFLLPINWIKSVKKTQQGQPSNRQGTPSSVQGSLRISPGVESIGLVVARDHNNISTQDSAQTGSGAQDQHDVSTQGSDTVANLVQIGPGNVQDPHRVLAQDLNAALANPDASQGTVGGVRLVEDNAYNSSHSTAKDVAGATWSFTQTLLKRLPDVVDLNPVKIAAGLVKIVLEIKDEVKGNIDAVEQRIILTMNQLKDVENALAGWQPNTAEEIQGMKYYHVALEHEYKNLLDLRAESIFKKIAVHADNKGEIANIFGRINQAREQLVLATGLRVHRTVLAIRDDVVKLLLERLKPSRVADHKFELEGEQRQLLRRVVCTPGTRVRVLADIVKWANDTSSESQTVYWLTGQAGSGKSTIAYTIARRFEFVGDSDDTIDLGGNFFCSRQIMEAKSATRIIRTIAYHLALKSKAFSDALHAIGKFESIYQSIGAQLEGLLVEPWLKAWHTEPLRFLIVIDALDEIEGTGGSQFLRDLLDTINKHHLPGLKFFATSRPEPNLVAHLSTFEDKKFYRLEQVSDTEAESDITTYLNINLPVFIGRSEMEVVVTQAAGLFIYAATVVKHLAGFTKLEQKRRLDKLLVSHSAALHTPVETSLLDALYMQILSEAFSRFTDQEKLERLQILHTFLCTAEKTSTSVVADLLFPLNTEDDPLFTYTEIADDVLAHLYAVLYIENNMVFSYHKSFTDFIFNSKQAKEFYCDQEKHHQFLTQSCFQIMKGLKFNIAHIETSYIFNKDNPTLPKAIKQNISPVLCYSCQYWNYHLLAVSESINSGILCDVLQEFVQLRVLFWIEAMHLLGLHGHCEQMLQKASKWVLNKNLVLSDELAEAGSFALYFSGSQAAMSTPHLYISALSTWPRHIQQWRKHFPKIPIFRNSPQNEKPLIAIETKNIIFAVAYSTDNNYIASGSYYGLVSVWQVSTSTMRTLRGHTDYVRSVSFSSDNKHIVSGSDDKSIRIWEASTGALVKILEGHTKEVNSVVFSSDNKHIVSGSNDGSVKVWDAFTGLILMILEGNTGTVTSVAFSSNNKHIVSASRVLQVWEASTGTMLKTLKGHDGGFSSVVFSNDNKYIVSGSYNKSIYVWEASTGVMLKTLQGHTGSVNSVAFSSDNKYIASGSNDRSVRIWDALTGAILKILEGHTNYVWSIAFSGNNRHIVSGSYDGSMRVWEASPSPMLRTQKTHTIEVNSVAFSNDNKSIVSGSSDGSVQVWEASTGTMLQMMMVANSSAVNSVAFSHDNTHVVSGSDNGLIQLWKASTGACLKTLVAHENVAVYSVAFSGDDRYIVSGSSDRSMRIWEASTGEMLKIIDGYHTWVNPVAFSMDNKHIMNDTSYGSVWVWEASAGVILKMLEGPTDYVPSVAFSSTSNTHPAFDLVNRSLQVEEPSKNDMLKRLKGHISYIYSAAFSCDSKCIISGSNDGSRQVWIPSTPLYVRHQIQNSSNKSWKYTGWLCSPTNIEHYLMFVPLNENIFDPANVLDIPKHMTASVDFTSAALGPDWIKCYSNLSE